MAAPADKRGASRHAQRGVAAIFAAISLLTLISALALGIDVGRLYYAQRDLQRLADLAAVDAARVAQGCLLGPADPALAQTEAQDSVTRNGTVTGLTILADMGVRQSVNGLLRFKPAGPTEVPDSVRVKLTRPSPAHILPLFSGGNTATLTAQAAALSNAISSQHSESEPGTLQAPDILNKYFGSVLGGGVNLDATGHRSAAQASVKLGDVIEARVGADVGPQVIPQEPELVKGLLTRISEALSAAGNPAAAAAVGAYAAASNGVGQVIPAQVFGIPLDTPRSAYQDLSVNVGTVLNNIAATVANGSALTIPIDLPYPLGDTTMTVRPVFIPGTAGVTTPGSDPGSQDSDGISVSGGLVDFRIHLLDPSTGKKIELPVLVSVKELQPKALDVQCSRRGLPQHSVKLLVHERVATFAIAAVQNYDSTGLNVLDPSNLLPAELLAVKVLGQKIKISVNAGPITIGNPAGQIITLSCPQASKSTDCINASQPIGGANGGTALTAADQLVSSMRLSVEGLPTTNTPLDTALIVAVQLITDSLNTQLKTALNLLAAQIIPLTEGVNISVVPTTAFLDSVNAPPPTLYAQ